MFQRTGEIVLRPPGPGLHPITREVAGWIAQQTRGEGLVTLFLRHTSASLTIQENADPDVPLDLQDALAALAPHGGAERYRHHTEGPDDMAAHVRAALTGVSHQIPVREGRMMLGTWQGLYLWEHRDQPGERRLALHLLADKPA